jgi:hypothetical protein
MLIQVRPLHCSESFSGVGDTFAFAVVVFACQMGEREGFGGFFGVFPNFSFRLVCTGYMMAERSFACVHRTMHS